MGILARIGFVVVVVSALALVASANAAYPGENGRVAFQRSTSSFSTSIYTMNPDGSDVVVLPGTTESNVHYRDPAWTPDGNRIGFIRSVVNGGRTMWVADADGSSPQQLPGNSSPFGPTWSPDGSKFAYSAGCCGFTHIFSANLDGTGAQQLTGSDPDDPDLGAGQNPTWSPTGERIAYQGLGRVIDDGDEMIGNYGALTVLATGGGEQSVPNQPVPDKLGATYMDWSPDGSRLAISAQATSFCHPTEGCTGTGPHDIWVIDVSGSSPAVNLTNSAANDVQPAWSPDGTKLAFVSTAGTGGIFSMNADGTGVVQLTTGGFSPNWQPVSTPSTYVRPKSAAFLRVALVPAYNPCTAPNREHGPPLAFGSCAPPQPRTPRLSIGVGDGHPALARTSAYMRMRVLESDVKLRVGVPNVMYAADRAEYTGELRGELTVRRTDREGAVGSTSMEFPLGVTVPCVATPASSLDASDCTATTTVNALIPGAVASGDRTIWALDQARVYDGGADEDADTTGDNSLFMTQGVFVP